MELLDAVCGAGANAVYVAQPHYLFQPATESLISMFRRLRARVQVPVLLANLLNSAQVELAAMLRMMEDRAVDGIVVSGLPLFFYSYSACQIQIDDCVPVFKVSALLIDIIVVLGLPLLVNYFANRKQV